STINISGIQSSPDMRLDGAQELVLGERLRQVVLGTYDPAASAIEQAILGRQHDHGNGAENLVVLYEGARLITIQTRHHDVDEHDVRLVVRNFRERIEAVDGRIDLAPLLGEERLGRAADRLTVVDHQDLETLELRVAAGHDERQLLPLLGCI